MRPVVAVIFVTGPVSSGKSAFGVRLARESGREVTYVATAAGAPEDVEWRARLMRHVLDRPSSWRTVETASMSREAQLALFRQASPNACLLVDALGADMMLVSNELEKLILFVGRKKRITIGDVETMVLGAKQRSLYELTDAISSRDRVRAMAVLDALLSSEEGEEAAIGHIYMLARTFRQMLVILEKNVRDSRAIWQALWQGFRVPPFAAEDVIRQARRYKSRRELTRALRLLARADLALRSNPASKRLVLEKLVLDLCTEPAEITTPWAQEELVL